MKKRPPITPHRDWQYFMDFYHPPLLPMPDIPVCYHYGTYLIKRRFDVHTGVDLYAPDGATVYAVEQGEVVGIRPFTGKHAGCPHWEETWAIDIVGYTGTLCYGEITPNPCLKIGDDVNRGQHVGTIKKVLKKEKGKSTSMLHFAVHHHGWKHLVAEQNDPDLESFYDLQTDPRMLLIQLKHKADMMMLRNEIEDNYASVEAYGIRHF